MKNKWGRDGRRIVGSQRELDAVENLMRLMLQAGQLADKLGLEWCGVELDKILKELEYSHAKIEAQHRRDFSINPEMIRPMDPEKFTWRYQELPYVDRSRHIEEPLK